MANPTMHHQKTRATYRVAWINATLNVILSSLKITLGILGRSHALIADGLHSLTDLVADGLILIAAKLSGRAPDCEHPYGHQRIETVATVLIALLILSVALGIGADAIEHLIRQPLHSSPEPIVLLAACISILANESLCRYIQHINRRIESRLLESCAWHNRSDALVSLLVFVSVAGSLLGIPMLDVIGSMLIALLILKTAANMLYHSINELIDTGANAQVIAKIGNFVEQQKGVVSMHQLRSRSHGGALLLDLHLEVAPKISVSEGHFIASTVAAALLEQFEKIIDVTVHIDPEDDSTPMKNASADREHIESLLRKHWHSFLPTIEPLSTTLHYLNGKIDVDLYLTEDQIILLQANDLYPYDLQTAAHNIPELGQLRIFSQIAVTHKE